MLTRNAVITCCLLVSLVGPAFGQEHRTFCQRLAPELGLKQSVEAGRTAWRVNQAGGLGRALFGGPPVMTSIGLDPIDADSLSEYKRLKDACGTTAKGILCKIIGPAKLHLRTKSKETIADLNRGEGAEVEVSGATITCRDIDGSQAP